MLNDPIYFLRCSSARVLGQLQATEAIPQLLEMLQKDNDMGRSHVAFALGQLKVTEAIPRLLEMIYENNSYLRAFTGYALSKLQVAEAIPQLINMLNDQDISIQPDAANALEQFDRNILLNGILLGISHYNLNIRRKSITVIGYYSINEETEKILKEIIETEYNKDIKKTAKWN